MVHVYGFFLGLGNLHICFRYRDAVVSSLRRRKGQPRARALLLCAQFFALPLACLLSMAPLSTPFLSIILLQQHVWNNACSHFPLEVVLQGRYYHAPMSLAVASFYYWQNGVRVRFFDFAMPPPTNNSDAFSFVFRSISSDVEVPQDLYPLIYNITYSPNNNTLSGDCRSSVNAPAGSEEVCLDGQYNDAPLSFNVTDTRTRTNYQWIVSDRQWFYPDNTDGPSLILHDVNPDGPVAMRTAVTGVDCTFLKVCSAKLSGPDLLVPIGRILKAQDGYAFSRSKPT